MRWWLIVLSGCYRAATLCEDCPLADADVTPDGEPPADVRPDAGNLPIAACSENQFLTLPMLPLVPGATSYTTNGVTAIFEDLGASSDRIREIPADSGSSGGPIQFQNDTLFDLSHPRLAPDGLQIFFLGRDTNTDVYSLVRSERVIPNLWTVPAPVTVSAPANLIDQDFIPGVPTSTQPRRMIAGKGTNLFEGKEDSLGNWEFEQLAPFAASGVREPFLSRDGLALLFVATAGSVQIFRAIRTLQGGAFNNPAPVLNFTGVGGDEHTPAFSPDCETLYWSMDNSATFSAH